MQSSCTKCSMKTKKKDCRIHVERLGLLQLDSLSKKKYLNVSPTFRCICSVYPMWGHDDSPSDDVKFYHLHPNLVAEDETCDSCYLVSDISFCRWLKRKQHPRNIRILDTSLSPDTVLHLLNSNPLHYTCMWYMMRSVILTAHLKRIKQEEWLERGATFSLLSKVLVALESLRRWRKVPNDDTSVCVTVSQITYLDH